MKNLYLIRHGKTQANEDHVYCGRTDLPLTSSGRQELEELRSAYHELVPDKAFLCGSGMKRTNETIQILFGRPVDSVLPGFREMDFGLFEGFSHKKLMEQKNYRDWLEGDNFANICPGGESGSIMQLRVLNAFSGLLQQDYENVVVCTHGGPIGTVMEFLFPEVYSYWYSWQPEPGHGWRILFETAGKASEYRAIP